MRKTLILFLLVLFSSTQVYSKNNEKAEFDTTIQFIKTCKENVDNFCNGFIIGLILGQHQADLKLISFLGPEKQKMLLGMGESDKEFCLSSQIPENIGFHFAKWIHDNAEAYNQEVLKQQSPEQTVLSYLKSTYPCKKGK